MKKVEKDELHEKLDFLGLKLEKLPKFITEASVPNFPISKSNNDKDLKVYKFVPINEIEILLTPCLRSDPIKKKYAEAMPLKCFLNDDGDEEEIMLYKTFAKIVRNMSISEIEKIEEQQDNFAMEAPFKVKYRRDHLWQIYYSVEDKKYFMLVCTKEETFSEFLYLLKMQMEFSKTRKKNAPQIYVPIQYMGYSEQILQNSEIVDVENQLWLFTKNWPLVFEVYDEEEKLSLQIVGETFVYKNIKSYYKVVLSSLEEGIKFYKLLKALFILQTEIKGQYHFETRVDSDNRLSFYLSKVEITFDSLATFIKNEFLLADYEIKNQNNNRIQLQKQLADLKIQVKEKEDEYLRKQRQISTYLECKKSFFGKMKYFFHSEKKEKSKLENQSMEDIVEVESPKVDTKPLKTYMEEKEFYTIEDLVTIYALHEKGEKIDKKIIQDSKALELKLENLTAKVRNANQYIEEIDKHKKSIFEFWKFANKDEKLALEMADNKENEKAKQEVKKFFDLDSDFEKLGEEADKIQRKKLSKEEMDSVFIAQTELLPIMNRMRSNQMVKEELEEALEQLEEEFNQNRLVIDDEAFDIFGNLSEMNHKVRYIGSRSHRELDKNKFKIMNINKKIDVFDFTEKVQSIVNYLEGAVPKITSFYDMPLYKLVPISKTIEENDFALYNINVEDELEQFKEDQASAYNLICLNYKEGMPLLYYSNIMFLDNTNRTLPMGMNLSSKVLVDQKRFEFVLVNKTKFTTNSYFHAQEDNDTLKTRDIFVYEYDVFLKDEENPIKEDTKKENLLEINDVILEEEESVEERKMPEEKLDKNDEYYEDITNKQLGRENSEEKANKKKRKSKK